MKKRATLLSAFVLFGCALLPSSVFANKGNTERSSCVEFFEHIDYGGKSITYCNDVSNVGNAWNDTFSSAKVSSGNGVIVYEHSDYAGDRWELRPGNYSNFKNQGWNDRISSVDIK
ncbi:Beta/Gamma crystallin [Seinonella peptonophila]|uniref:Beta/Gamma crystallin n=1 Tax=Seinonella peptonophila TaxID=112248 RepID=A0A1M4UZ87_9BACL|nr:beta/gamma crystallin-related protein [Seinonella peptonophila]SHE61992.1 Beta/Gamma crystallin [Seinonella peptonophila]